MATNKHVFIAHRWDYSGDYDSIIACLSRTKYNISDYSDPKSDPLTSKGNYLTRSIRNQIDRSSVLLVSNRPATGYSDWVQGEVDYARRIGTPVIAVRCTESTASWIQSYSIPVVACRKDSLENAIDAL
jgi:hypothetical protein